MCARPRLDDSLLKHPRKIRKSTIDGPILTDKPPTVRMLKKWRATLKLCENMIWSQPPRTDNVLNKVLVDLTHKKPWKKPEGFPRGCIVREDEKVIVRRYNPEQVLLWGYQYRLTDKNPRMIYEQRRRYLCQAERFINDVLDLSDLGL